MNVDRPEDSKGIIRADTSCILSPNVFTNMGNKLAVYCDTPESSRTREDIYNSSMNEETSFLTDHRRVNIKTTVNYVKVSTRNFESIVNDRTANNEKLELQKQIETYVGDQKQNENELVAVTLDHASSECEDGEERVNKACDVQKAVRDVQEHEVFRFEDISEANHFNLESNDPDDDFFNESFRSKKIVTDSQGREYGNSTSDKNDDDNNSVITEPDKEFNNCTESVIGTNFQERENNFLITNEDATDSVSTEPEDSSDDESLTIDNLLHNQYEHNSAAAKVDVDLGKRMNVNTSLPVDRTTEHNDSSSVRLEEKEECNQKDLESEIEGVSCEIEKVIECYNESVVSSKPNQENHKKSVKNKDMGNEMNENVILVTKKSIERLDNLLTPSEDDNECGCISSQLHNDDCIKDVDNTNDESYEIVRVSAEPEVHSLSHSDDEPLHVIQDLKKKHVGSGKKQTFESVVKSSLPLGYDSSLEGVKDTDHSHDERSNIIYLSGVSDDEDSNSDTVQSTSYVIKSSPQSLSPVERSTDRNMTANPSHIVLIPEYMIKEEIFVDENDGCRSPEKTSRALFFAEYPNLKIDPNIILRDPSIKLEKFDWLENNPNAACIVDSEPNSRNRSRALPTKQLQRRVVMGKKPSPQKISPPSTRRNSGSPPQPRTAQTRTIRLQIVSVKSKAPLPKNTDLNNSAVSKSKIPLNNSSKCNSKAAQLRKTSLSDSATNKSRSPQPRKTGLDDSTANEKADVLQSDRKSRRLIGVAPEKKFQDLDKEIDDRRSKLFFKVKHDRSRVVAKKSTSGVETSKKKQLFVKSTMSDLAVKVPRLDFPMKDTSVSKKPKRVSFANELFIENNSTENPFASEYSRQRSLDGGGDNNMSGTEIRTRTSLKRPNTSTDVDNVCKKTKNFQIPIDNIISNNNGHSSRQENNNDHNYFLASDDGPDGDLSAVVDEKEVHQTRNKNKSSNTKPKEKITRSNSFKTNYSNKRDKNRKVNFQNSEDRSSSDSDEANACNSVIERKKDRSMLLKYQTGITKYLDTAEFYRAVMNTFYECECCEQKFHLLEKMREHVKGHFPDALAE